MNVTTRTHRYGPCRACGLPHPGRCPHTDTAAPRRASRLDAHRHARRVRRGGAA